ncbi:MAG: Rho termination factor N-terminal domain-containing protein, partial [Streptomycetales bacterium]
MSDTTDLRDVRQAEQPTDTTSREAKNDAAAPETRSRRRSSGSGLSGMVLPELQALASSLGITGIGRMRKSQLIEAIRAKQGDARQTGGGPAGGRAEQPIGGGAPSVGEQHADGTGRREGAPTGSEAAGRSETPGESSGASDEGARESSGAERGRAESGQG